MKIIDWDGCNKISEDRTQCTITNVQESKTIMPRIQYKESVYSDNVKDLTGYVVSINDNNYTVNLDLDTNVETRNFIEGIITDDIIIKRDGEDRFFRKVVSVTKVDDYNYIISTDDMSFLEVYKQGGMSLNRNLTHEDLAEDLETINRSLQTKGAILLPPKHKNDDEFTIVYLDNSLNRAITIDDLDSGHEFEQPIYDNDGIKVSIKGSITFNISTNFDYNSNWYGGLESMRMVTKTITKGKIILKSAGVYTLDDLRGKQTRISLLGSASRGLSFNIPSGWLMLKANVKLFAGFEGEASAEVEFGLQRESTTRTGFNYYSGNIDIIKDTTSNVSPIMELAGKVSVGGYLSIEPGIEALYIAKLGIEAKTGAYAEFSLDTNDIASGKLDWKSSIKPRFDFIGLLSTAGWAREQQNKINNLMPVYTYTRNIWSTPPLTELKPALLFLTSPVMNETVYSDTDIIEKNYTMTIKNTGEEKLKWKIEKSGSLSFALYIAQMSGELEKDESINILVDFSFYAVSDLVGENLEGHIKVINETNGLGSVDKKVTLEVIPRLATPSNLNNVYFSGISTTFINFDLPDYTWDDFTSYYDDRGFKIFASKEVSGECGNDYQLFHSIDVINNRDEIFEHQWTKINLKDKMERLGLDYGERYCFKLSSYLKGYSSESTPTAKYYIPALGSIKTSIKDRDSNPIENARVHLTSTSDNSVADGNGNVIFENLIPGTYLITVEADGFINTPSQVVVSEGEETLFEGIRLIEEELEGTSGVISGKIINALNSANIDNISIEVRAGNSNTSGEVIASTTTDSNGQYSFTLETGNYTFSVSKSGYTSSFLNVLVIGNETTTQDLSLSPILSAGEMRIVLRWGDAPSDLDSHLVKKTDGVQDYHIYYSNKTSDGDSLDRDDTDSVGPETVTISNVDTASVYTYYVYNYSHNSNTELKSSSATIDITYGNDTYRRSIPNEDGYYWKVFEVVNGEVVLCTTGCVQDDTSTLIRSIDREENELFKNLPSKN